MSSVGSNSAFRLSPSGVRATSSGEGAVAYAVTPTSADGAVVPACSILGRDTFSNLLCRLCLRYACRAHGARQGMDLLAPPLTAPRHLPVDHDRMRTHMAAGGHVLAPDVLGTARRLFIRGAGPAAAAAAAALGDDMSSGSSAAAARNHRAGVQHKALSVAGGSCVDCRHDVRSHPSIFQCGLGAPAEDRWTAKQAALLYAAAELVGRLDTRRLACFVPGRTCRGAALYLDSLGWPPATATAEGAVEEEAEGVQAPRCALAPAAKSETSAHVGDVLSPGDAVMSSLEDAAAPEKVAALPAVHAQRTTSRRPLQLCANGASLRQVLWLLGHTLDFRWGAGPTKRNVSALGRCRSKRDGGWLFSVPAAHVVHLSPSRELQHRRLLVLQGGTRVRPGRMFVLWGTLAPALWCRRHHPAKWTAGRRTNGTWFSRCGHRGTCSEGRCRSRGVWAAKWWHLWGHPTMP